MDTNLREIVLKLADPLLKANGLALWGLEIVPGPVIKVCLYVDVPDGANGEYSASIDQCEAISRQLGLALEVEECLNQRWVLEVSSPGLDRIFFSLAQMRPYIGEVVDARLKELLQGTNRKSWRGILKDVGADSFELTPATVTSEGEVVPDGAPVVMIPWSEVSRCRLVPVFKIPQKPGKKPSAREKKR